VRQNVRHIARSHFRVRDCLSPLEHAWLIGCLVSRHGVRQVTCSDEDPRHLTVEYDTRRMTSTDLMDAFYICGLHAEPIQD
jgi:hypothetical protein